MPDLPFIRDTLCYGHESSGLFTYCCIFPHGKCICVAQAAWGLHGEEVHDVRRACAAGKVGDVGVGMCVYVRWVRLHLLGHVDTQG